MTLSKTTRFEIITFISSLRVFLKLKVAKRGLLWQLIQVSLSEFFVLSRCSVLPCSRRDKKFSHLSLLPTSCLLKLALSSGLGHPRNAFPVVLSLWRRTDVILSYFLKIISDVTGPDFQVRQNAPACHHRRSQVDTVVHSACRNCRKRFFLEAYGEYAVTDCTRVLRCLECQHCTDTYWQDKERLDADNERKRQQREQEKSKTRERAQSYMAAAPPRFMAPVYASHPTVSPPLPQLPPGQAVQSAASFPTRSEQGRLEDKVSCPVMSCPVMSGRVQSCPVVSRLSSIFSLDQHYDALS